MGGRSRKAENSIKRIIDCHMAEKGKNPQKNKVNRKYSLMDICTAFKRSGKIFQRFCSVVQHAGLSAVGGERRAAGGVFPRFRVGNAAVFSAAWHCRMDCREVCREDCRKRAVYRIREPVSAGVSFMFSVCGKLRD